MSKPLICLLFFLSPLLLASQYKDFPGHSHNDYLQDHPLKTALSLDYHQIEIDVYALNDQLVVSHFPIFLKQKATIEEIYFSENVEQLINDNKEAGKKIVYMIDIKNKPEDCLQLIRKLKLKYDSLIYDQCSNQKGSIKLVVSGNWEAKLLTDQDLCYLFIDGRLNREYSQKQLENIHMVSFSFKKLKKKYKKDWPTALRNLYNSLDDKQQKCRLWSTPNKPEYWKEMLDIGVQFINVDDLEKFKAYYLNWQKAKMLSN